MDLLTTYTHHLELQPITEPPIISTIHSSPQHPLSFFQPAVSSSAVPWQRLPAVEILQLPTLTSILYRLSFRTACQLSNPQLSIQLCAATANYLFAIYSQILSQTPEILLIIIRSPVHLLARGRVALLSNSNCNRMEAIRSSETSVNTSARCHLPKDCFLHSHRREKIKSYTGTIVL
jgi:hypothetical protein